MLEGKLQKYKIFKIYKQLGESKSIGTLYLRNGKNNSAIYFHEGKVIFAKTNNSKDRIGDMLIREGELTPEQLQEAINLQRENFVNKRIGSILVNNFSINPNVLAQKLKEQILRVVDSLYEWSGVHYQFFDHALPNEEDITINLSVENIILRGARRVDKWDYIQEELPGFDTILRVAPIKEDYFRDVKLLSEEWNLLQYINGYFSIKEICQIAKKSEFETCRILYRLKVAGLIERVPNIHFSKLNYLEKKIDRLNKLLTKNLRKIH